MDAEKTRHTEGRGGPNRNVECEFLLNGKPLKRQFKVFTLFYRFVNTSSAVIYWTRLERPRGRRKDGYVLKELSLR